MKTACLLLSLACLLTQPVRAQSADLHLQTLDGMLSPAERKAATDSLREAETTVFIQDDASLLRITVQSEPIGVASLCVATAERVWVLHASAALGHLAYHQEDATWTTAAGFVWALRDTAMTAAAMEARRAYLQEQGWVATTYQMGHPGVTEFLIRRDLMPAETRYLALGIMPRARPAEIIGVPSESVGDCARGDLVRGPAPLEGLRFEPALWKQIATQ